MQIKFPLILFVYLVLLHGFVIANVKPSQNIKFVGILRDDKGHKLGKVYIEDFKYIAFFKADIFKKLVIISTKRGITDTLYKINNCVFTNPKGTDITTSSKNFNGYKIESLKKDFIELFEIGDEHTGTGASDPAIIQWDYKKKLFKVDQSD